MSAFVSFGRILLFTKNNIKKEKRKKKESFYHFLQKQSPQHVVLSNVLETLDYTCTMIIF